MPTVAPSHSAQSTPNTRRIAPRRGADGDRPTLPPGYERGANGKGRSSPSSNPASTNGKSGVRRSSLAKRLWRTIKSIYYASSPAWQFLKSGALLLLGLFFWSASNLLLSYEPDWHWPYFFMAYGFLLTPYGPFTHLVLVPHLIPWLRRRPRDSWLHALGRHLTLTSLTLFFSAVLWLGLYPPNVMQMGFGAPAATETVDVNPKLVCSNGITEAAATVECHLEQTDGVASISVETGSRHLLEKSQPPFAFSVNVDQLVEVVGQRQFHVVVYDASQEPVRRFNKTVSAHP